MEVWKNLKGDVGEIMGCREMQRKEKYGKGEEVEDVS